MAVQIKDQQTSLAKTKIHWEDPLAVAKFCWDLTARLQQAGINNERDKVLLCIGTDRSTGDSLGPLIGSKMLSLVQDNFHVMGTLDNPVHASNLKDTLEHIYSRFIDPYIIAIDACLGSIESVGHISIGDGALQPGAGVHKDLPPVGDIHITGTVNVGGFMEYLVLQNTRLNIVMKMADLIADGLTRTISETSQLNVG